MKLRIVLVIASAIFCVSSLCGQDLKQPLAGYNGPRIKHLGTLPPHAFEVVQYVPSGNLCPQMREWGKKSRYKLTLGAPIEMGEWRELSIAGGTTAWIWMPAGTKYWEYNGIALFMGPLPSGLNIPKNEKTGCCNPIGVGYVPPPISVPIFEPAVKPVVEPAPTPVPPPLPDIIPVVETPPPTPQPVTQPAPAPAPEPIFVPAAPPRSVVVVAQPAPRKKFECGKTCKVIVGLGVSVAVGGILASRRGHHQPAFAKPPALTTKTGAPLCTPDPRTGFCPGS